MLLLGAQLTTIFFKGMLGLPFGIADTSVKIQLAPFSLAVAVMCFILAMIIFTTADLALCPVGGGDSGMGSLAIVFSINDLAGW